MCGFLVYRTSGDNTRIRHRGPDLTNTLRYGGFTFVHNLLSITGAFTPQPFVEDDVVCLYNGEIYNQPYTHSDGEVLIRLYRKHGPLFARKLDGEFAIALYDLRQELAVFATDPFKTKPLFISGVECASYRSGVGGEKALPNQIVVKSFDGRCIDIAPVKQWDLTQFKDSYDHWIEAFLRAVGKRAQPRCFIGLSSGYDSGAIACALSEGGVDFKAYSFTDGEDQATIEARLQLVPDYQRCVAEFALMPWLRRNVDDEPYTIRYRGGGPCDLKVLDDRASLGLATIARLARSEGRRVMLSGQGSDEIMSDYAPWPDQSEIDGVFPATLTLWNNFNYSCQESYLMKEEYISGAFGIEARYPFLDAAVVQEFLWLTPEAKNRHYKAPLHHFLEARGYPFEKNAKRGFVVDVRLPDRLSRLKEGQAIG
jgi:asparagine synthetase B (glutamine-hydrolysing)